MLLVAASHSPLIDKGEAPPETIQAIGAAFASLTEEIEQFEPEIVIQFSPDHLNGFFYDVMPAICVGVNAESIGDWGTTAGRVAVPEDEALAMGTYLLGQGFDPAISYRMQIDHGFIQLWDKTVGAIPAPLIPIFMNCAAPPLMTTRRARELGEAVGRFAASLNKRVLIAASGGLSHDPPTPQMAGASPELRERLISNRNPSVEARAAREARVLAAGKAVLEGGGEILPVSEAWDRAFLAAISGGEPKAFDEVQVDDIVAEAGRGGPETLCWIAAMAALRVSGRVQATVHHYEAVQGWIAGMAFLSARTD